MAPMTLTLPKLIIAAVVIWLAWRWFSRFTAGNQSGRSKDPGTTNRGTANHTAQKPEAAPREQRAIEDMVKCPKCGSYVPAKGGHDCTAEARRN